MESPFGPSDFDDEKKILELGDLLCADYDKFSYPRATSDAVFPKEFTEEIRLGLVEAKKEQANLIQQLEYSFIDAEETAEGSYNEYSHVKRWILRRAVTAVYFRRIELFIDAMIEANLHALHSGQIAADADSKLHAKAKSGFDYRSMIQEFFLGKSHDRHDWRSYDLTSRDQMGYSDFQKEVLTESHILLKSLSRALANKRLEKVAGLS